MRDCLTCRRETFRSAIPALLSAIMLMAALLAIGTGCSASGPSAGDRAPNGIPAIYITVDPVDFQRVLDSTDHSYRAYGGTVSIAVPENYKGDYSEVELRDLNGLSLEYIRGRGNSTWLQDKRPFKIKLGNEVNVLGMGKSKQWNLISNAYDPSLLRNRLILAIGSKYGLEFTPKALPVDLYINGEYQGSYLISQSVRVEKTRVDIDEIPSGATTEPEITGGYLLAMSPDSDELENNTFETERGVRFRLKTPRFASDDFKDSVGSQEQRDYITGYLQSAEDAIFGEDQKDADGTSWTEYVDLDSAAKYWLVQQLCENGDAYRTDSTYLYKQRNGKLYWGPLWDFDITCDPATYDGSLNSISMTWLNHLRANDPEFREAVVRAWGELEPILDEVTKDGGLIDQYADEVRASWEQDNQLWHADDSAESSDLDTQVIELKHYINRKREAINGSLDQLGECQGSSSSSQGSQDESSSEGQDIPGAQDDDIASGISGTCYWRIDAQGHMTIGPTDGSEGTLGTWANSSQRPWYSYTSKIKSVSFSGTVHAQTCLAMFYHCYHLSSIDFTGFDTSAAKSLRGMFAWCWSLEELDVSGLDTSAATSMNQMFLACNGLTSLDLSTFDLSSTTDMQSMFYRCYHLESVVLPKGGTCKVEKMRGMFADCHELKSVDLSGLDTSSVTSMRALFYRCYNLSDVNLVGLDTSNVTAMDYLFAECRSLVSLDLSSFDTSKVTDMSCMFLDCAKLTDLDLTLDTSSATSKEHMFDGCDALDTTAYESQLKKQ